MPKVIDPQFMNSTIQSTVEAAFDRLLHIKPTAETVILERDIIEFESRMRLFPMEKFNGPCFISIVNYFLSQKDLEAGHAIGTFVVYVKEEVAEKFLRAFNRSIKDAEDENNLLNVVAEMAGILAGEVKGRIVLGGYQELFISAPTKFKNHVSEGALFDYNLYHKQELSFFFWGQKCVVIEACLGHVSQNT